MSEIKLKPCPFCGGEGKLKNVFDGSSVVVKCKECGAEVRTIRASTKFCADERAAEIWNQRNESQLVKINIEGLPFIISIIKGVIYKTDECEFKSKKFKKGFVYALNRIIEVLEEEFNKNA